MSIMDSNYNKMLAARVDRETYQRFHNKSLRIGGHSTALRTLIETYLNGVINIEITDDGEIHVRTRDSKA